MKTVFTSYDLNSLTDQLISKICQCWKDPFCPPVVVFADSKVEQWFRQYWIKNSTNHILMNLKGVRLESFIYDIIASPENKSKVKFLEGDLFRSLIISRLTEKTSSGKYFFQEIDGPEVEEYLLENGVLNEDRLFDFANEIAFRFSQYEFTRPDLNGEKGVIKNWAEGKDYFTCEDVSLKSREAWQRNLYNQLFKDEIVIDGIEYLTLSQLILQNQNANGNKIKFYYDKKRPVFLFGFSGLGQIYRTIFNEFANENDLYVFIQSGAEESKNKLVQLFGESGKESVQLWNTEPVKVEAQISGESVLGKVRKSILENTVIDFTKQSDDSSIEVIAAPTKLREVEALHTNICKLLKDEKAKISDILVLSPNIQDYKVPVFQVFNQNNEEELDYPAIPYNIADYSSSGSMVAEAVSVFCNIYHNKYFSRGNLFSLARNTVVKHVRQISDEQVEEWSSWINELNVYRDREGIKDWDKAKNRLLLARLTENLVVTDEEERFEPFVSSSTEENDYLFKLIDLIDDLQHWTNLCTKKDFALEDIEEIQALFDKFLLIRNNVPDYVSGEDHVYEDVVEEIKRQKDILLKQESKTVSAQCFLLSVSGIASNSNFSKGTVFTNGISFIDFKPNRIISAKYIFLLGMDSLNFPKTDHTNILDLRTVKHDGDVSISASNKNAFLCLIMAATEKLCISYVNMNLKKDQMLFRSSVVDDLCKLLLIKEKVLNIDEDRSWNDLFTSRSVRNKDNILLLKNSGNNTDGITLLESENKNDEEEYEEDLNLPDRVKVSEIRSFLFDPFRFSVQKIFDNFEDHTNTDNEELEPVVLDAGILEDEIIACGKEMYNSRMFDEQEYYNQLRDRNILPDGEFGKENYKKIIEAAKILADSLRDLIDMNRVVTDHVFMDTFECKYSSDADGKTQTKEWVLNGTACWYFIDEAKLELNVIDITGFRSFLNAYCSALGLMATLPENEDAEYSVKLCIVNKAGFGGSETIQLTKKSARELLEDIYFSAYVEKYSKCISVAMTEKYVKKYYQLLNKSESEEDFEMKQETELNWNWYKDNLLDCYANEWKKYKKRYLFEDLTEVGFEEKTFVKDFKEAVTKKLNLIIYMDRGQDL